MTPPAVFISYSHDSQEHKQWVLDLATRLRSSGVDAILDQWELGPGSDLPQFMEQNLSRATRVLMICTERYVEKANAGVGGVGYEKMIVTADLLRTIGCNRIIPIVRQSGTVHLPTFLGTKMYIDLSTRDLFESGMDQLLRELLSAPLFIKPPLGSDPFKAVTGTAQPSAPSPAKQFMQAVAKVYDDSGENGLLYTTQVREVMNTSKLFFDHAFDQALSLKYVSGSPAGKHFWVQEAGRAMMMTLALDEAEKN
ncbi:toll/interleukin-1 receptor domain-containing protein [Massilia varians]